MSFTVTSYCDDQDVYDVLSEFGVLTATDDEDRDYLDATLLLRFRQRAAAKMNGLLVRRYPDFTKLVGNDWCKTVNATLAAYELSTRRMNSSSPALEQERNDYIQELKDIGDGHVWASIPGTGEQFDTRPAISNFSVHRGTLVPARVVVQESTGDDPPTDVQRFTAEDARSRRFS